MFACLSHITIPKMGLMLPFGLIQEIRPIANKIISIQNSFNEHGLVEELGEIQYLLNSLVKILKDFAPKLDELSGCSIHPINEIDEIDVIDEIDEIDELRNTYSELKLFIIHLEVLIENGKSSKHQIE